MKLKYIFIPQGTEKWFFTVIAKYRFDFPVKVKYIYIMWLDIVLLSVTLLTALITP